MTGENLPTSYGAAIFELQALRHLCDQWSASYDALELDVRMLQEALAAANDDADATRAELAELQRRVDLATAP